MYKKFFSFIAQSYFATIQAFFASMLQKKKSLCLEKSFPPSLSIPPASTLSLLDPLSFSSSSFWCQREGESERVGSLLPFVFPFFWQMLQIAPHLASSRLEECSPLSFYGKDSGGFLEGREKK